MTSATGAASKVSVLQHRARSSRVPPPEPATAGSARAGEPGSQPLSTEAVEAELQAWRLFPDLNPNPVLRVAADGIVAYANPASGPILAALGVHAGEALPGDVLAEVQANGPEHRTLELPGSGGRVFAIRPVPDPELGWTTLYGTDVTAARAIDRYPMRNPNPVMRVSRDGRLTFANPASAPIRQAFGLAVGQPVPGDLFAQVLARGEADDGEPIEVAFGGRVFELLVASLAEFDSLNLYGTDVTAARQVEQAARENERLLLNILPVSIARRLRDGEVVIADRFDEMTVLFADIVDFTPLSGRLSATALVDILNRVFSAFDHLAEHHGLEKIKTVGDAYMVAGGLTDRADDHAERVADMALDMLDTVVRVTTDAGEPLSIRVGLHVGPAVAGVIGIKKFIYDVWGDTVNTASRMESHGVPGRIQVTDETARRLAGTHRFEPRGSIEVKGMGPLHTSFLVGRHAGSPAVMRDATPGSAGVPHG